MKLAALLLIVAVPILMSFGAFVGYRAGVRRNQALCLRSLGLSPLTINRYRDAMRLLGGMVEATSLDGPYVGNVLTTATEQEARRIVAGYRQEMGIDR